MCLDRLLPISDLPKASEGFKVYISSSGSLYPCVVHKGITESLPTNKWIKAKDPYFIGSLLTSDTHIPYLRRSYKLQRQTK